MDYKIGIVEWAFPFPGPAGFKIASELGIEGMELDFGDFETGYKLSNPLIQETYLELGEKYQIKFPSIALNALNAHGMSNNMDSYDGLIAVEIIEKGIEAAYAMGIGVVQLPSFNNGAICTESDFLNTCEKIRYACESGKKRGITIGAENVLSAKDTIRMIEEVDCDNLKIFYDTQNYYLEKGYSQVDIWEGIKDYVCQVHLKDGMNNKISSALLGKGNTSFEDTINCIRQSQVEWLLLENYYHTRPLSLMEKDPFQIIIKDIKIVKKLLEK